MKRRKASQSDEKLVKRCLAGQREAFAELVNKYKAMIYGLTYRMTGTPWDAEDLAQETFLHAYRALSGFQPGRTFSTWLYTIALNLCRDKAKRKRRVFFWLDKPVAGTEDLYPQVPSDKMTPEEALEAKEDEARLRHALAALAAHDREVIVLRYQQRLEYREIADVLGVSLDTVKVRLHRARQRLQKLFSETDV
ncbi:MAG: sigma-70 family RNA polymerase sigma factor [Kiritimatiellae bacterium]|nr:sigma-70 family RNA polymerase sigma factor [Kiritimatiellia bacterium]